MTNIRLGLVGAGNFLPSFAPLFAAHPGVASVHVADLELSRADAAVRKYGLSGAVRTLDDLLAQGVDAVAIFTPRHTHAALAQQAMEAGVHACMAVPAAVTLDELRQLTETSARTRRVCMTGETSFYYPEIVFCREEFASGRFGAFVHSDAQYIHDWATWGPHFKGTFGPDWRRFAAIPPMHYATHSFSMPLSITGARVTHVSAHGFTDTDPDSGYGAGKNPWDNPFSDTVMLGRTSDGGTIRVGEFRRLGWFAERNGREVMMPTFYCTDACFEENMGSTMLTGRQGDEGSFGWEHEIKLTMDISAWVDGPYFENPQGASDMTRQLGLAPAHHPARLPDSMKGLHNGHSGSHQYLVDDFIRGCLEGALPPTHIWNSAAWCAPGLVAHESALQGGTMLPVPDFGTPPADWLLLTYPSRGEEPARPRLPAIKGRG
ncbi:MAG: Gfo/Idh/MocA family oxidoreductase [Rhodobacterales bacterium]|nr:Gfo/Idh/MocA family oxidoreductase [Rhodobacterales bacterium]